MKLLNQTRKTEMAAQVRVADSFWLRAKGLLGESQISRGDCLWIQGSRWIGCNSIHTFFMRFSIDAVFVDREMKVKAVYRNLQPWRMTRPVPGAMSVFELPAGTISDSQIAIGDQLHVGD